MRHGRLLVVVAGLMLAGAASLPAAQTVNLMAGQHMLAGQVTVTNDASYLYVKITTTGGWVLTESHVAVAKTLSGIPQTKTGNPQPGQFPYKRAYDPPKTEDQYKISLKGLKNGPLYIAVHTVVEKGGQTTQEIIVVSDSETQVISGNESGATYPKPAVHAWEPFGAELDSYWDVNLDYDFSAGGADWIWETERVLHPVQGDIVAFERTFDVQGTPAAAALKITCDNGYEVYLNGVLVGSAQLSPGWETSDLTQNYVDFNNWQSVESYDVVAQVQQGQNVLTVNAVNEFMGPPEGFPFYGPPPYDIDAGYGTIDLNPAGLIYELKVTATQGEPAQEETAWAAGLGFPGKNWATYFTYTLQ